MPCFVRCPEETVGRSETFIATDLRQRTLPNLHLSMRSQVRTSVQDRHDRVSSDLNALKYTITAIREELSDNISVLVNCAGNSSSEGRFDDATV